MDPLYSDAGQSLGYLNHHARPAEVEQGLDTANLRCKYFS